MAEVIDITEYRKKKEEEELDLLSTKLANLIEEMGIKEDFEMYMENIDDVYLGIPYIYTMYGPMYQSNDVDVSQVKTLSDITDVLTKLTIQLDEMGYIKWADQISSVVGEMFISGSFEGI